jgi:hypothetical protein
MHLSSTFCSKAWSDVNIDFARRSVRHCCKSVNEYMPEQLDTEFFNASPGILERREALQAGIEHTNCKHCWSSYRKSGGAYRDVYNTGKIEPIKFVEVKLDNLCDMTCQYCDARSSHKIAQKLGIKQSVLQADDQDYAVFLDWLQTLKDPYTLSFLGGEVTYSKNFVKFAELMLQKLYKQDLFISIMTNANTLPKQQQKFFELLDRFPNNWRVIVVISNESTGNVSETVREGLSWPRFETNVRNYFARTQLEFIGLCPTLSTLTVDHFSDYMYWVGELAREYNIQLYITGNSVDHSGPLSLQYCDNTKQSLVNDWHKLFNQYADVIMNLDDCLIWLEKVRKEITSNAV